MVKVSIIIPVYNAEDFLEETLSSVARQSFIDFECIIIDDVSTDNSLNIAKKFSKKDSRFSVFQNSINGGAGLCRNAGLKHAKGRYVAFLDSDDIWVTNKLEKQIVFMQEKECSITYGAYGNMNFKGVINAIVVSPPKSFSIYSYMSNTSIGLSTSMIDKDRVGDFIFASRRTRQDCELWINLLSKKHIALRFTDTPCVYYRKHNTQISRNKFKMAMNTFNLYMTQPYLNKTVAFFCFIGYAFNAVKKRV